MQRIDGPTRSAVLPVPAAQGTGGNAPGYFSNGDPLTATPPTTVSADWFNMIQEELTAVVLHAGIALDKANRGQVLAAILAILDQQESAPSFVAAVPGYRIGADGYVEQWGVVPGPISARGNRVVAFPMAFPNACLGIQAVPINSSSSTTGGTTVIQEVSVDASGATLRAQNEDTSITDCAGGIRWRAWGH